MERLPTERARKVASPVGLRDVNGKKSLIVNLTTSTEKNLGLNLAKHPELLLENVKTVQILSQMIKRDVKLVLKRPVELQLGHKTEEQPADSVLKDAETKPNLAKHAVSIVPSKTNNEAKCDITNLESLPSKHMEGANANVAEKWSRHF